MPETHKCAVLLQEIIKRRRGKKRGEGPQEFIHRWPDGGSVTVSGLPNYVVGEDVGILRRYKGEHVLISIAIGEPISYKKLYIEGQSFRRQNKNTADKYLIAKHLNTIFDCPVTHMIRNFNWRAPNLNKIKGFFELCAFLDRPRNELVSHLLVSFGDKREDLDALDTKLYLKSDEVKADILNRLEIAEERLDTLEETVKELGRRLDRHGELLESHGNRINGLEEKFSALLKGNKEDVVVGNSILRKPTKAIAKRRVCFDNQWGVKLIPVHYRTWNLGTESLYMTDSIILSSNTTLGIVPSLAEKGGCQVGILRDFECRLPKTEIPNQCESMKSERDMTTEEREEAKKRREATKQELSVCQKNKVVPFGATGSIAVFGRPAYVTTTDSFIDWENDVDFDGVKLTLGFVDWQHQPDGTFSAIVLRFGSVIDYLKKNPDHGSMILPANLFWNSGRRVTFEQVIAMGQGIPQLGTSEESEIASIRHGTIVRANVKVTEKAECALVLGPASLSAKVA